MFGRLFLWSPKFFWHITSAFNILHILFRGTSESERVERESNKIAYYYDLKTGKKKSIGEIIEVESFYLNTLQFCTILSSTVKVLNGASLFSRLDLFNWSITQLVPRFTCNLLLLFFTETDMFHCNASINLRVNSELAQIILLNSSGTNHPLTPI